MRIRNPNRSCLPLIALCVTALSAACQPLTGHSPTAGSTDASIFTPSSTDTVLPTPSAGVSSLVIWLPPTFRPDSNSPAGNLLQQRMEAFKTQHYGVDIMVRIKAATGAGGLRDSLTAAAAAAPGALPDVVALDQSNLRAAAIKSLIHPLNSLLPSDTWSVYYPFARQMVVVDGQYFGLPFTADAMVMANTLIPASDPLRWEDAHAWANPLVLPLGDSRALFLFYGYYAAGGAQMLSVADAVIDPEPLAQELDWLYIMQEHEVLSGRSLQIDTFDASFLAISNFGESAATMYSIASGAGDFYLGFLPTPHGETFSLATGWSWAVATPDPLRQTMAAELMAWLSDPEFLAEWTEAQGVLPPSTGVLELWPIGLRTSLAEGVLEGAPAFPNDEITAFAGPILAKAARKVLLEGILPMDAANEAAKAIQP